MPCRRWAAPYLVPGYFPRPLNYPPRSRYFGPAAGGDANTYLQLIELFNETTWQTELGQMLDLTSQPQPGSGLPIDLDRFTLERYRAIVEYKT